MKKLLLLFVFSLVIGQALCQSRIYDKRSHNQVLQDRIDQKFKKFRNLQDTSLSLGKIIEKYYNSTSYKTLPYLSEISKTVDLEIYDFKLSLLICLENRLFRFLLPAFIFISLFIFFNSCIIYRDYNAGKNIYISSEGQFQLSESQSFIYLGYFFFLFFFLLFSANCAL
jgi:hypothetical protein